jgi:hypothetical protein
MELAQYVELKHRVMVAGYYQEIQWAESVREPADAETFFSEYAWVVINSGMKNTVARKIWTRIQCVLAANGKVSDAFGHPGKAAAIQEVYDERESLFESYRSAADKLVFIEKMPWIGPITKWHLAKNYGFDVAKPDRHLVRIAARYGKSVTQLCKDLADATGDRVATVDLVLWRAASLGWT